MIDSFQSQLLIAIVILVDDCIDHQRIDTELSIVLLYLCPRWIRQLSLNHSSVVTCVTSILLKVFELLLVFRELCITGVLLIEILLTHNFNLVLKGVSQLLHINLLLEFDVCVCECCLLSKQSCLLIEFLFFDVLLLD